MLPQFYRINTGVVVVKVTGNRYFLFTSNMTNFLSLKFDCSLKIKEYRNVTVTCYLLPQERKVEMTAKQYLQQAYRLNELINSDLAELEQLRVLATSVSSPNLSGMPSGGSRNTEPAFVRAIEKIYDLEKVINAEIDRFVDLKKEIRIVINQVPDNSQKLVLKLRYIQFLKWESVAAEMDLSLKQVHRIHNEALKNVKLPFTETK